MENNKVRLVLFIIITFKLIYDIIVFLTVNNATLNQFIEKTLLTLILYLLVFIGKK